MAFNAFKSLDVISIFSLFTYKNTVLIITPLHYNYLTAQGEV